MKTYILKFDCHNDITIPRGSIVRVNDVDWEFEVMRGKLKGTKGNIADGLGGWLVPNTKINRDMFAFAKDRQKHLMRGLREIESGLNKIKPVHKNRL